MSVIVSQFVLHSAASPYLATAASLVVLYSCKRLYALIRERLSDVVSDAEIEQMMAALALLDAALESGEVKLINPSDPVERMRAAVALQNRLAEMSKSVQ